MKDIWCLQCPLDDAYGTLSTYSTEPVELLCYRDYVPESFYNSFQLCLSNQEPDDTVLSPGGMIHRQNRRLAVGVRSIAKLLGNNARLEARWPFRGRGQGNRRV